MYTAEDIPPKDTPEYHKYYLRKLKNWLSRNPKNLPVVTAEAEAVEWALGELDGNS